MAKEIRKSKKKSGHAVAYRVEIKVKAYEGERFEIPHEMDVLDALSGAMFGMEEFSDGGCCVSTKILKEK